MVSGQGRVTGHRKNVHVQQHPSGDIYIVTWLPLPRNKVEVLRFKTHAIVKNVQQVMQLNNSRGDTAFLFRLKKKHNYMYVGRRIFTFRSTRPITRFGGTVAADDTGKYYLLNWDPPSTMSAAIAKKVNRSLARSYFNMLKNMFTGVMYNNMITTTRALRESVYKLKPMQVFDEVTI